MRSNISDSPSTASNSTRPTESILRSSAIRSSFTGSGRDDDLRESNGKFSLEMKSIQETHEEEDHTIT